MTLRNRFHANKFQNFALTTCQVPKPVMQPFGVSTVFVPLLATWLQGDRRFSKKSVTKKGPGRLVGINAWQVTDFDIGFHKMQLRMRRRMPGNLETR